ncbi:hypothetical protein HMPREF9120_02927 [Neisseria sp. oral taxon 020 str. F0370]|nr:hypothetical protein HMPREF9120_02927 [Neisseria sp. oral taxon 020 str. F0370]
MQHGAGVADAFGAVGAGVGQHFVEAVEDKLVDGGAVAEADFGFGGVDVDVYSLGRQFEKEDEGGGEGVVQHVAVGLFDGVQHDFVAHEAAVDEAVLLRAFAFGEGGFGNQAAQAHAACGGGDGQGGRLKIGAEHGGHALFEALRRVGKQGFAVAFEGEGHGGIGEGEAFDNGGAVGVFGSVGFEEFAAGGGVEEEVGRFHRRAFGMGGGGHGGEGAVFGADLVGVRLAALAAGEGEAADGGNAGQPFAAKTHAGDVLQIAEAGDFAGGVARQGKGQVVGVDARAVVGDAQAFHAARIGLRLYRRRARVEAVFDDFFECGGWTLDHFAGGNLVDEVVGQGGYAGHGGGSFGGKRRHYKAKGDEAVPA